jgi:hypothetical protein
MGSRVINPWTWQNQFAFVQAHEVSGAERVLYCAGQTSVTATEIRSTRGTCEPSSRRR